MLSWRAPRRDDDERTQVAAAERRRRDSGSDGGDGECFWLSAVADECAATAVLEGGATSATEPAEAGIEGQVAEASSCLGTCSSSSAKSRVGSISISSISSSSLNSLSCSSKESSSSSSSSSRPMVVVQVQGATDTVSYLAVGSSRRSSFSQHRSFQLHPSSPSSSSSSSSSPSSSSLVSSCLQDTVPMVALECELSLSGRLSPPPPPPAAAELSRSMSAPFLSSVAAGAAADPDQHLLHNGAAGDPVHSLGEGGSHAGGSHQHLTGSFAPAHLCPGANVAARSGSKRKLPRREDAICEEEEEEMAERGVVDYRSQTLVAGLARGCCGEEREDVSPRKRRRLDEGEEGQEGRGDVNSADSTSSVEGHGGVVVVDRPRNHHYLTAQQKVNCVVYDCLTTVSVSTNPPAAETEVSVVMEDSPDSVVEVDVVGDVEEEVGGSESSSAHLCRSNMEGITDTEPCSSGEASSEDGEDDAFLMTPRPTRISPFLNTPKQRKEERRKILKMSIHKMRSVEDPEHFLRRSVLINNTMKRLQRELREEKMRNNPRRSCYGLYRRASSLHYDVLNNSYLLHDEPFAVGENDRITDDMTDALVTKLEATSSPVAPTPSPSPCPAEELDTSPMMFSTASSEPPPPPPWSSEVTSTVPELSTHLTSTDCMPEPSVTSSEELMSSISSSASETVSTTLGAGGDLTSCSSSSSSSSSPSLPSPDSPSSSSSSSPSCTLYEGVFSVPGLGRDPQSPSSSCSSQSQREKQLYADIDTVFNNLIHALGDS